MAKVDKTRGTVLTLLGVVLFMGGLAWAAVPFFTWFSRVTGYGGVTGVAVADPARILDRTIKVRFDTNVAQGMPWTFTPKQRQMELRIGETGQAYFDAYNPSDHAIAGHAVYNVTPTGAGRFFKKTACFCFATQVLQSGEHAEMPVTFFVDPDIVGDNDAKYTKVVTLSYTFYQTDLPEEQAALAQNAETGRTVN